MVPRETPHVVARVGHHPHFRLGQLRIGLDAVDQRRAARRCREQPLEDDEPRALLEDGLQRLNGFGIGERDELAFVRSRSRSDGVRLKRRSPRLAQTRRQFTMRHDAPFL